MAAIYGILSYKVIQYGYISKGLTARFNKIEQ